MSYKSLLNPAANDVSHTSELTKARNAQAIDDVKGFENGNFVKTAKNIKFFLLLNMLKRLVFALIFPRRLALIQAATNFKLKQ